MEKVGFKFDGMALWEVRKRRVFFARHFIHPKMIILPRQARDKHGESTQKETRLLA